MLIRLFLWVLGLVVVLFSFVDRVCVICGVFVLDLFLLIGLGFDVAVFTVFV